MLTRNDVPHEDRLPGPIVITVKEVDTQPRNPRDAELTATDKSGDELRVVIWEKHNVDQEWHEGQEYELEDARGKRYTPVEIHSTKAFQARETDRNKSTRLFVMGDTHVGYRHRTQADKPDRAKSVDGREVFTECLERARETDADVVVHAGDVFDHCTTKNDRDQVEQEINRTVQSGIPFYYVYGNHDYERCRQLLNSTRGIHLTEDAAPIGEQSVNLLGVDHSGKEFLTKAPEISTGLLLNRNILVIHETPYPVVDDKGKISHQNDGNKADISDFIDTARYDIDLVIVGHLHVAKRALVRGYDVPVLVTGSTLPISKYEKDSRPSTWLLTVTGKGIELDRQPL